ncbi:MAG: hypothetical protein JSW07_13095 [bacterium]|nr:MAG: hypothetical protein JSW07_13095 [bacterium]
MNSQSKIEDLISAARDGDKNAEEEFFAKLTVRFSTFITRELRNYPILINGINLDERSREVCQVAIKEVKRVCPLSTSKFTMVKAINVLHNVVETFVTNSLVSLAKKGDTKAEDALFSILRKRLMERITKKRWRKSQYGNENR